MPILKMSELDLAGKRVLIREDFNVPLQDGLISDDTRIRASLPGIKDAIAKKARLLLVSHLGRPTEGQFDEKESLAPVARRLSELLQIEVPLKRDWLEGVPYPLANHPHVDRAGEGQWLAPQRRGDVGVFGGVQSEAVPGLEIRVRPVVLPPRGA